MKRQSHWARPRIGHWLVLGFVLTLTATCSPADEDDPVREGVETVAAPILVTAIASRPTVTPATESGTTDTISPPPLPTAEPTVVASMEPMDDWIQVGGEVSALELSAPPGWVNISGRINVSAAKRRLGLLVLLIADSERTGQSILAGKKINSGAFAATLLVDQELYPEDPVQSLSALLEGMESQVDILSPPTSVAESRTADALPAGTPADEIVAASVDVSGDPLDLFDSTASGLRTRFLLFPFNARLGISSEVGQAILLLLSAPASQWDRYDETFALMAESFVTHRIRSGIVIGDGAANFMGRLGNMEPINGKLDSDVHDLWSFTTQPTGYATLTLSPTDKDIDLSMAIIGPTGSTVARIDNGYAGDAEVAADLLLIDEGTYVVEVGEFFGDSGRYTLNLSLSEAPLFDGRGRIAPGQGIQSELPDGARHVWSFSGTAGELVSIILIPGPDQFDAILDLYDPEGTRLVGLDEGFSGDAEVISGFELPVTGEYTIQVRSFAGNGGTYALSLDEGGELTRNFFDAGSLVSGDTKEERLRGEEAHAWFIDGRVGDVISIEVKPLDESLDLEVWLLDPDVNRLVVEDRFATGEGESFERQLSQDGQFLIMVRDFFGETGAYSIEFTSRKAHIPSDAGTLAYGITVTNTLAAGESALWRIWAETDDVITIGLDPLEPDVDVVLVLQDPLANTIVEVDDELAGESEVIGGFKITADGQWRLLVKEFFNNQGDYTLTVERRQP